MVNQALVAIFKRPGRFAALAILVLTVGASLVSTVPGFFGTVLAMILVTDRRRSLPGRELRLA
ncbi:hypothetical protein [Amycolatopsis decaplanina]|uniref:hypothetical protein n=1 Tax=Amycolatopsis decaplanina TaxID=208441 RepID=UPI001F47285E|nr:hypothetical protein [Amycolatopsis decaplanina]